MPAIRPTAAEINLIVRLANEGWTPEDIAGLSRLPVATICTIGTERGVTFSNKRADAAKVTAEITALVNTARKRYEPVCTERTIDAPSDCPQPYTLASTFRVGSIPNVPVDRLRQLVARR